MFSVAVELGASHGLGHYLPLAVSEELRGYAEERSQVRADALRGQVVSITGLSARFCPTGRDLYLEKMIRVDTPSWERSVIGKVVDSALVELHKIGLEQMENAFERAVSSGKGVNLDDLQTSILTVGEESVRRLLLTEWRYPGTDNDLKDLAIEAFAERVAGEGGGDLVARTLSAIHELIRHETTLFINHLRRSRRGPLGVGFITRSTGWMAEARAVLTRLQTGVKLDRNQEEARFFGVAPNIKPDFLYAVTLIGDVKAGKYKHFQESVATGYAILAEYALRRRINTAFILAVDFDLAAGKLRSHRVIRVRVDNEHRLLWITQRDFALRVLRAGGAPAHPQDLLPCTDCPYRNHCWDGGTPGQRPVTPTAPVRAAAPPRPPAVT